MTIPTNIKADIDDRALTRIPRMFDGTLSTIIAELLQNARRSKATQIAIDVREILINDNTPGASITILDNGEGIEDPQTLLSYGANGWDHPTTDREDAAGMGFACLSKHGCHITSRHRNTPLWTATLDPDHFIGKAQAAIDTPDPTDLPGLLHHTGTEITFTGPYHHNYAARIIREAATYYPIAITLATPEHLPPETLEPRDFLSAAIEVHQWQGLRIGIMKHASPYLQNLNFFGHTLHIANLPAITSINGTTWSAIIDVQECPELTLVLPDRARVADTPFLDKLKEQLENLILATMANHIPGGDAYIPYRYQAKATALGLSFPAPPRVLHPFIPETDSNACRDEAPRPVPPGAWLINPAAIERAEQHTLYHALPAVNRSKSLFLTNLDLDGYTWYDNLDRITDCQLSAQTNNQTKTLRDMTAHERIALAQNSTNDLRITLTWANRATGLELSQSWPAPLALMATPDEDWCQEPGSVILGDKSAWNMPALHAILTDAYFCHDTDAEESYDSQLNYFDTATTGFLAKLLDKQNSELPRAITDTLNTHLIYDYGFTLEPNASYRLTVNEQGRFTVTPDQTTP